ncbi:MAG: hypothetical protein H0T90_09015 [Gemmatimonadales bacterium]|nr:hypothetical protein [Gemmatimonadales bacterium]
MSRRWAAPALVLAALLPDPLSAQIVAAGQVVRPSGGDTVNVAAVRVVLHQVGRDIQGPIDSALSSARGRFRFFFQADSGALYLLSARYGGIEYFSTPVHTNPERPDTAIRVVVHDTSSTAAVALAARHIVIPRPDKDGARTVLDLIVLRNDGESARVAPDSLRPSWTGPLPPSSIGIEVGESDVSPDAVSREGDSVFVAAPIAPGEKQIALQYLLPSDGGPVEIPIGREGGTVNLLVEEVGASASGAGLALADSQTIDGRSFRRWTGEMSPGTVMRVTLPGAGRATVPVLAALVGALALALAAAAWLLLARRSAPVTAEEPPDTPNRLLDALGALDARYADRERETDPEEWSRYLTERTRLKASLEATLAGLGSER